ncbi:MAG: hypothetical protein ACREEC_07735, partial [Thermoplasmata archaeon]
PSEKRAEIDRILKEDRIARQSHKVRDAAAAGGKAGETYVLVEGSGEAVQLAEEMLAAVGVRPSPAEAERLYRLFEAEDESASAGMGLFFTEG